MKYVEVCSGKWSSNPEPWFIGFLKRIFLAGNPDLEDSYYPHTYYWWVELDERNIPHREIGFDERRIPIVLGPVGNNYGFIVDTSEAWASEDEENSEAARRFEDVWDELWPKFKHLGQQ